MALPAPKTTTATAVDTGGRSHAHTHTHAAARGEYVVVTFNASSDPRKGSRLVLVEPDTSPGAGAFAAADGRKYVCNHVRDFTDTLTHAFAHRGTEQHMGAGKERGGGGGSEAAGGRGGAWVRAVKLKGAISDVDAHGIAMALRDVLPVARGMEMVAMKGACFHSKEGLSAVAGALQHALPAGCKVTAGKKTELRGLSSMSVEDVVAALSALVAPASHEATGTGTHAEVPPRGVKMKFKLCEALVRAESLETTVTADPDVSQVCHSATTIKVRGPLTDRLAKALGQVLDASRRVHKIVFARYQASSGTAAHAVAGQLWARRDHGADFVVAVKNKAVGAAIKQSIKEIADIHALEERIIAYGSKK